MNISELLPLTWATASLIALGAALAGFATGLAGFGTALVAPAFWLHVVDARVAGPLVAICAVASQATRSVYRIAGPTAEVGAAVHISRALRSHSSAMLPATPENLSSLSHSLAMARYAVHAPSAGIIWRGMHWPRLWPMLPGEVLGLRIGIVLLERIDTEVLKGVVGMVLVGYAAYNLLRGRVHVPRWGGRGADAAVGEIGGVLGGASGLAGVLPTVWCAMRGWPRDQQRGAYQPYSLAILALAIPGHAMSGALDARVGAASIIAIPVSLAGGWVGVACYGHLDERQFRLVVLWLLLVSGLLLLPSLMSELSI